MELTMWNYCLWLQDSMARETHSGYRTREQSVSPVIGAEVFPKVDSCVLFPNVFTSQEVINSEMDTLHS